MIVETGRVVAVDNDVAWVETVRRSSCGACASQESCGPNLLDRFLAGRRTHVRVRLAGGERQVAINDLVEIGLAENMIVRASALAYLLPLAGLILGAAAGPRAGFVESADAASMIGAAAGFGLAMLGVRWLSTGRVLGGAEPVLVRVLASRDAECERVLARAGD